MKHFLIAATLLGLIAGCATEPSAPSSTASESEQGLSAPPREPRSCPVPWDGPGSYYLCEATGVIERDQTACRAACNDVPCEFVWSCRADACELCVSF